jgi:hypothetical protein
MNGPPPNWQNPVTVGPGQLQTNVDPQTLLPSRLDLVRTRLESQRQLIRAGQRRWTPILVTVQGIIYDGHHAVRAAAEEGVTVDIQVVDQALTASAASILALPVR